MSSLKSDLIDSHRSTAEHLTNFLYVDGKSGNTKKPGVRIQHTYEELWDKLESIRQDCYDMYNTAKNDDY